MTRSVSGSPLATPCWKTLSIISPPCDAGRFYTKTGPVAGCSVHGDPDRAWEGHWFVVASGPRSAGGHDRPLGGIHARIELDIRCGYPAGLVEVRIENDIPAAHAAHAQ